MGFGRSAGRSDRNHVRSPADVAERAHAAVEAHHDRMRGRLGTAEDAPDLAPVSRIEAAVEDGLARLQQEAERLADELHAEFTARHGHPSGYHPAARHLAEVYERIMEIKELGAEGADRRGRDGPA